jgi:filamentous hemagglutinin
VSPVFTQSQWQTRRGISGIASWWGGRAAGAINQTSNAILKNGYYEVNGFKFSEYYFNKLWSTGRGAPSLVAKEVLEGGAKTAVPDAIKAGFNKYVYGGWEMVYNPATKEVWHLQPIR